jgi:mycothiol synthase
MLPQRCGRLPPPGDHRDAIVLTSLDRGGDVLETGQQGEELARRDGVSVRMLGGDDAVDDVVAFLERREEAAGTPLVDESEHIRLDRLAAPGGDDDLPEHWCPLVAVIDDGPVGYAGFHAPGGGDVDVDVVADPGPVLSALVDTVTELARLHDAEGRLRIWTRAAEDATQTQLEDLGLRPQRRLLILARDLDMPPAEPDPPGGVILRRYEGDLDDDAVVALLRTAYEGTADGGWDLETFRERRGRDWFRAEDLIIAEGRHADVVGIHWMKRRDGRVGEVHNLAVDPEAQGLGLGRALLRAGLRHLWRLGCREVLLWVDAANEAAVDLYRSEGFEERSVDVAFAS